MNEAHFAPAPHVDLFSWSREQAIHRKVQLEREQELEASLERIDGVLVETTEFKEAKVAAEDLAESKKAAVDASQDVAADRVIVKEKRAALRQVDAFKERRKVAKALKALRATSQGADRRIVQALAEGRVPPRVEVLPSGRTIEKDKDGNVTMFEAPRDGKAAAAGKD